MTSRLAFLWMMVVSCLLLASPVWAQKKKKTTAPPRTSSLRDMVIAPLQTRWPENMKVQAVSPSRTNFLNPEVPDYLEIDYRQARQEKTRQPMPGMSRTANLEPPLMRRSYLGFKGGYNLSSLNGAEAIAATLGEGAQIPYLNEGGYQAGLALQIGLSRRISLVFEPTYSQRGFEATRGRANLLRTRSTYIDGPLLLRYSMGTNNMLFYFNIGGYGAYWLEGTAEAMRNGQAPTELPLLVEVMTLDKAQSNLIDYGLVGGLGFSVRMGAGQNRWFFESRYQYGLQDPGRQAGAFNLFRNRTIGLTTGYLFKL
jgi:Outer membrane protein beta-barrel domain